MTVSQAGTTYLSVICKANAVNDALTAAVFAKPFNFQNGQQAAVNMRESWRDVVKALTAKTTVWPAEVAPDIAAFTEALYGEINEVNILAMQTNEAAFWQQWNSWNAAGKPQPAGAAAQKIRLKLELAADSAKSCNT